MMNKAHVFILVALAMLVPTEAGAHKASVFAYVEAGQVHAEGHFFDGRPCRGCAISVLARKGDKVLFEGKTDEQGVYTFKDPIDTRPLIIRMDAGEGHLAVFTLEAREVARKNTEVESQVEERLASLRAEIRRLSLESERPGVVEILGGLGYIAGLAGLWLYVLSRRRDKK